MNETVKKIYSVKSCHTLRILYKNERILEANGLLSKVNTVLRNYFESQFDVIYEIKDEIHQGNGEQSALLDHVNVFRAVILKLIGLFKFLDRLTAAV